MRALYLVMRVVFCVILVCSLTSCINHYPKQFATLEEAYPSPQAYQITPDVPGDSYKKAVFNAPYADVFRALEVAATQVGQNIESSDKSKGLILATRVAPHAWPGMTGSSTTHFFYAITVKELKSRTTEVVVCSKVQIACTSWGTGGACRKFSTLHWAAGGDTEAYSQLINFTRNNLIAAGAL